MKRILLLTVLALVLFTRISTAQVPQIMSYQAVLTDAEGNPVADNNYSITFKLYEQAEGGSTIWEETQDVTVTNGIVTVNLGSVMPLALPFDKPYWLGICIGDAEELSPRTALTSAPYSLNAAMADGTGDGHSLDAADGDPTDAVSVDNEGNVGIGTTTPSARLDVVGTTELNGDVTINSNVTIGDSTLFVDGTLDRVGIGTSLPGQKLSVVGTIESTEGGFKFPDGTTQTTAAISTSGDGHSLDAADGDPVDAVFVDSDGNVGIGTTTPSARLNVVGTTELNGDVTINSNVTIDDSTLFVDGTLGRVGIGTTTPSQKLTVSGNVNLSGFLRIERPDANFFINNVQAAPNWNYFYLAAPDRQFVRYDYGSGAGPLGIEGVLRLNAANRAEIQIGNEQDPRFMVDSNGNVGIGTSLPGQKLSVVGTIESTEGGFRFPDGTTQTTAAISASGDGHSLDAVDGDPVDAVFVDSDGNVGIGTTTPSARLNVVGTTQLNGDVTINSDVTINDSTLFVDGTLDRVGIGTTTPSQKLTVSGNISLSERLILEQTDASFSLKNVQAGPNWNYFFIGAPDRQFVRYDYGSGAGQFGLEGVLRITASNRAEIIIGSGGDPKFMVGLNGNVGIGTTSPATKLDVNGAITLSPSGAAAGPSLVNSVDGVLVTGGASSGIRFNNQDNTLELMRITNDGNVGIGTNGPNAKLSIHGITYIQGNDSTGFGHQFEPPIDLAIDDNDTGLEVPSDGNLAIYTNNVERMRIDHLGNVGIGTTTPDNPLEMASGAHVTAGGAWTDASSRQYKENIANLTQEEAVSALEKLNPVKFNYKVEKDEERVGFIAEDVPDLVATRDRKSLSPMDIVAVLTKVVQQQQKKIAELEARLNANK